MFGQRYYSDNITQHYSYILTQFKLRANKDILMLSDFKLGDNFVNLLIG